MKKFMLIFVNLLTMVRIIGVFMMIPVYFNYGGLYAAILSICCYLTDCIDGFLARKFHVATFFGSMFDGVADKLFSCSNLIILFKVTKYSIASIIFELAVVLIQFIKFQKIYLVTDINSLTFLSNDFINYINKINSNILYLTLFTPLYIFQILTLYSYLKFLRTYDITSKEDIPVVDINLKPKTSIKNRWDNFVTIWLDNDFYEKYKDSQGLKGIRKEIKHNDRI